VKAQPRLNLFTAGQHRMREDTWGRACRHIGKQEWVRNRPNLSRKVCGSVRTFFRGQGENSSRRTVGELSAQAGERGCVSEISVVLKNKQQPSGPWTLQSIPLKDLFKLRPVDFRILCKKTVFYEKKTDFRIKYKTRHIIIPSLGSWRSPDHAG
jgi:hypothetical protein